MNNIILITYFSSELWIFVSGYKRLYFSKFKVWHLILTLMCCKQVYTVEPRYKEVGYNKTLL